MSEWNMATGQMLSLGDSISKPTSQLDAMLHAKNRIAEIRQILSDLAQEKKYFDHYNAEAANSTEPRRSLLRLDAERALRLWLECERYFDKARVPAWWFRFKCAILYGIKNMDFKQNSPAQLIPVLQDLYYRLLRKEFESELVSLEKRLEGYRFKEKMRELENQSMTLFRAKLSERYGNEGIRRIFKKDDLWREADSFIKEYPVVLSTTYSIQSSLSKGFMFDYVIVDEASQVDLATGALAFACAKNVVIVGDLKQLPNVVTDENKKQAAKIANQYSIRDYYDYTMHSLLSSAVAIWPNAPRTLLREHYRCHPKIIGFCNQKFYDNQLIVMTEDHGEENVLGLYYTNPGNHARGRINQRQIDVIVGEIVPELNAPLERIGVVSPYRDQANYAAKTSNGSGMESDTVHKYQGREKENIIITTVDNQIGEFADNPNLLNVAVSRAIKRLRLVVSPDEYNENTNTGDLIRYIKYHNFIVVHSDIRSIFDLLYKSYSTKRLELLRHHRKVSQYDSENLMYDLILRVLADEPFQKLDVVLHHPLNTLLQNLEKLEENERIYALHPATHVDFVIYNKMDKAPMLAVEVDGVAFHAQNRNQERRDKLKDEILAKHGIPLLRLRTDGSGEDRKLRENLIRASVFR
jgi:hypothetical protein